MGRVTILIVYVNDIIITRNNDIQLIKLEEHLTTLLKVKKLGLLKYLLGIEIAQSTNGYLMIQHKYILDLLNETGLTQGRTSDTPIDINHRLTLSKDDPKIEIHSY